MKTTARTIKKAITKLADEEAWIEFGQGRPATIRQFDGGEIIVGYKSSDANSPVTRIVTPNSTAAL